jgi:hypothetical protein
MGRLKRDALKAGSTAVEEIYEFERIKYKLSPSKKKKSSEHTSTASFGLFGLSAEISSEVDNNAAVPSPSKYSSNASSSSSLSTSPLSTKSKPLWKRRDFVEQVNDSLDEDPTLDDLVRLGEFQSIQDDIRFALDTFTSSSTLKVKQLTLLKLLKSSLRSQDFLFCLYTSQDLVTCLPRFLAIDDQVRTSVFVIPLNCLC